MGPKERENLLRKFTRKMLFVVGRRREAEDRIKQLLLEAEGRGMHPADLAELRNLAVLEAEKCKQL